MCIRDSPGCAHDAFLTYCRKEKTKYESVLKAARREQTRDDMRKYKKSAWMR